MPSIQARSESGCILEPSVFDAVGKNRHEVSARLRHHNIAAFGVEQEVLATAASWVPSSLSDLVVVPNDVVDPTAYLGASGGVAGIEPEVPSVLGDLLPELLVVDYDAGEQPWCSL